MNEQWEYPVLLSQTGELQGGSRYILKKDVIVIGRSPSCDIVINDRQISRQHLIIRKTGAGYVLEDLDSKNGTYINGSAVQGSVGLQDGDVVQIALARKFIFLGTEATIPLSMADAAQMGLGRLRMDIPAHRVWVMGQELDPPLSLPQFRLLALLYQHPDRVVDRDEVIDAVWPESEAAGVSEQAIDALVRRLRERLSDVDAAHNYVLTVRGHGFRLDNPM